MRPIDELEKLSKDFKHLLHKVKPMNFSSENVEIKPFAQRDIQSEKALQKVLDELHGLADQFIEQLKQHDQLHLYDSVLKSDARTKQMVEELDEEQQKENGYLKTNNIRELKL